MLIYEKVHFVDLNCIIILQCTVQKHTKNITIIVIVIIVFFFIILNIVMVRGKQRVRKTAYRRIYNWCSSTDIIIVYNVLHSVNTQQYISTVVLYIHSGHIMTICFDRKRSSSRQ